jgi:KRAB domain-containing zinc finger protein
VCTLCKRRRFTELTLRWHMLKDHDYRPCKFCKAIFESEPALRDHVCPMQNFSCDKCPNKYRSFIGFMLHHKKVHSGVRHVCHVCGDQLSDVNSLRRHLTARHMLPRETVTPCHICGKQMRTKDSLWNHERRVHKESYRSGPCTLCGRIFSSGFGLRRHLATVHRDSQLQAPHALKLEDSTEIVPIADIAKEEEEEEEKNSDIFDKGHCKGKFTPIGT